MIVVFGRGVMEDLLGGGVANGSEVVSCVGSVEVIENGAESLGWKCTIKQY